MAKQRRIGIVVGDKLAKTAKVEVASFVSHPLYLKKVKKTRRFLVHDEKKEAKEGDTVEIQEGRPYSATKHWELVRIVEKSRLTPEERGVIEELSSALPRKERREPEPKKDKSP